MHMIHKLTFASIIFFISSSFAMEKPSQNNFLRAAKLADVPCMRQLIAQNNSQDILTRALAMAIKKGCTVTCDFIIKETSLNCNGHINGHSLFSCALHYKNSHALKLLLNKPEFNFRQNGSLTILDLLARDGYTSLIGSVLQKKIYTPQECRNALLIAVLNDQNNAAIEFLKQGICPNNGYAHNKTPLHRAIEKNNLIAVHALLKAGALVNQRDSLGHTPLNLAARIKEGIAIAQLLVDYGASTKKALKFAKSINDIKNVKQIEYWFPRQKITLMPLLNKEIIT